VLLAGVAILAGCTRDRSGGSNGSAPAAGSRIKIAGMGFENDQFFKLCEVGMSQAAKKAGVDFVYGNNASSLDKEISLVDTYATDRVQAIVIAPQNSKASVAALQRANQAGIKVVTYDTAIDAAFPVAVIRSDQTGLGSTTGKEAAQYIREKMGGNAKVAVISYISWMPEAATQRTQGFENEIKNMPGVRIVARQDAWMADKAIGVVEGILSAHPDVNLIWAANEGGTVGAVTAVRNDGKAGKIVVFGTDMSDQMAGFLLADDNVLQAVTGQKPVQIGEMALNTAVKAVHNQPVDKRVMLPGQLFTRRQPDEVRKYQAYLRSVAQ
jgi:ABC-type sugar transport system substrate-binding protein